jgi:hypothetical protein
MAFLGSPQPDWFSPPFNLIMRSLPQGRSGPFWAAG